jgi:hypothetical protein
LKKSFEGIIEAGRVLIEAKNELEHAQFIVWILCDLRFGTRGHREPDLRKAKMLMFLARNEIISNSCHWHDFPPSPPTLRELTHPLGGHPPLNAMRFLICRRGHHVQTMLGVTGVFLVLVILRHCYDRCLTAPS